MLLNDWQHSASPSQVAACLRLPSCGWVVGGWWSVAVVLGAAGCTRYHNGDYWFGEACGKVVMVGVAIGSSTTSTCALRIVRQC